jgi:Taurine catabolism dioxygenase TauD, TfdA family
MVPDRLSNDLRKSGWASIALGAQGVPFLTQAVTRIANSLGDIVPRRGGTFVERLSPRSSENARAKSLSRKFGCGALPLHCDTAHWLVPCRYIVLACAEPGHVEAPTVLLDTDSVSLSDEENLLTRSASFVVRNGRKSFYANLIDGQRSFVRLDPGCMEPVTDASIEAMNLYRCDRHRGKTVALHWKLGDILVIDNWRVLHGRGNVSNADPSRLLLRAYVQ